MGKLNLYLTIAGEENETKIVDLVSQTGGVVLALGYSTEGNSLTNQENHRVPTLRIADWSSIVSSSSRTNSTSTASDEGSSQSVVVHGIESKFGVDLGIDTDKELHVILKENGAGALSDMLKEAYGTGTKKKRPRK